MWTIIIIKNQVTFAGRPSVCVASESERAKRYHRKSGLSFSVVGIYNTSDQLTLHNCTFAMYDDTYRVSSCAVWLAGVLNCTMSDCQFVKSGICIAGPSLSEKSRGLPVLTGLFEVGYEADVKAKSWGELQEDVGVDNKTRLYMAMWAKQDPNTDMPNNLGDVIYTTNYGMSYSNPADISLDLLTVPQKVVLAEVESPYGARIVETAVNVATAGEPFEICFVAQNFGGDGHIAALLTV